MNQRVENKERKIEYKKEMEKYATFLWSIDKLFSINVLIKYLKKKLVITPHLLGIQFADANTIEI